MDDIPDISVDYAVMEKSDKIKVIKSGFEWNDVGSFDSLCEEIDSKEAVEIQSGNNFYYSESQNKIIASIGIEDLIVIDTRDALLISKKGETQKVKDIVKKLTNSKSLIEPLTVHRPSRGRMKC